MPARIGIVSPDAVFAESIAQRLRGWGVSVAVECDFTQAIPSAAAGRNLDLVLLDVRSCEDALLAWLRAVKHALPTLEVILLNLPGQVAVSIAAMRAGASAELSAPFDLAALRSTVSEALRRRNTRLGRARPTLRERFERAMSAATFAQAGEFETARELLGDDDGARPERDRAEVTDRGPGRIPGEEGA